MSLYTTQHFKPEIQSRALRNLGLPNDVLNKKVITVTNTGTTKSGKRLVSLHYNQAKIKNLLAGSSNYTAPQLEAIKKCRGIILDADSGEKYLSSYPYTNVILTNSVPFEGLFPIQVGDLTITPTWGKYTKCYGGTLVRSFMIDDEVKLSTHKTIDATKSHFGGSDNFVDIFLTRQNVFPSLSALYEHCPSDVIHLFILNDRELLVDSREKQDVDRIVYLKSFSIKNPDLVYDLTDFIELKNSTATKPITVCKALTPEDVNAILMGSPITVDPLLGDSITSEEDILRARKREMLKMFSGGDRIIYENSEGIFTLMPSSCHFRSRIMDGKVNIKSLFYKSLAEINSSALQPIAFSPPDLREIVKKIKNHELYDLSWYTPVEDQPLYTVLTNLIFIVPEHRLDECFEIYESYGPELLSAIRYMSSIRNELFDAIRENRLDTYEGMQSTGVKFRAYLAANIPHVFDSSIPLTKFVGPQSSWPVEVHDFYAEHYQILSDSESSQRDKDDAIEVMKLVSIITSGRDENLYSFVTYPNKVAKERDAIAKRLLKNSVPLDETDDYQIIDCV